MKIAVRIARVLMGGMLLLFGLNGFLHFMETPADYSPEAMAFLGALAESGYLFPLKSAVMVVSGATILTGLFAPLGLILFAPVLVNIIAFHVVLDDPAAGGAMPGYLLLVLGLFLAWYYRPSFRGVLSACPECAASEQTAQE
jgi:hypothetical protein